MPEKNEQRHVFSVLTENKPGVLARVAGLFSARGFNIESLSVGETETPERSRMTIAVKGAPSVLEQVRKHLEKLVDTIKVVNLTGEDRLERGMALLKLRVAPARRADVLRLAEVFHARVMDMRGRSLVLEVTGDEEKIDRFVQLLRDMDADAGASPEAALERAAAAGAERLAAALSAALGKSVKLPSAPRARHKKREPEVVLVEMARTGRISLKRD